MLVFSRHLRPALSVIALCACADIGTASTGPLTLAQAQSLALSDEPGVAAATARAASLAEQALASAALPDPQIRLGLANLPVDSLDLNREPMTQQQIGLRQAFPVAAGRRARQRHHEEQSKAMHFAAQMRRREVVRQVRKAWLQLRYWQQARHIVAANRQLFSKLVDVTRTLYSVGRKNQQDMVRAELELSRLHDRLFDIDEQTDASRAALAQWLGNTAANRPLAQRLPIWSVTAGIEELHARLQAHPQLRMLNAQIAGEAANIALARAQYKPSMAVDLSYGIREDDPLGRSRDDFFSVVVTLDVPLFTANRQDKKLNSAQHQQAAIKSERQLLARQLRRQLQASYARWRQLQLRIGLYDEKIVEQSRIQAQATLQAYRNDSSDFDDVMRAYISDLNTRLDYTRLQTDRAITYAELDFLVDFSEQERHRD